MDRRRGAAYEPAFYSDVIARLLPILQSACEMRTRTYAEAGWDGWSDWLGAGTVAYRFRQWRSFKKARGFVRGLNLKSFTEWRDYSKSSKKPDDIPATTDEAYATSGWSGYGDRLGTDRVANRFRQWRSFKKARAYARGLGLNSSMELVDYCKSGKKPETAALGLMLARSLRMRR
jgi:hypothetical protein